MAEPARTRKCERCGETKKLAFFSTSKMYKTNPKERFGDTCLECTYKDEEERLRLRAAHSKAVKKTERDATQRAKSRVRQGVKVREIAYAAQKAGLALTPKALEQVREQAKTQSQKRTADAHLRRLLKARAKSLKDTPEADLPAHLAFRPEDFPFLLPQKKKPSNVTSPEKDKGIELTPSDPENPESEPVAKLEPRAGDAAHRRKIAPAPGIDKEEVLRKELAARTLARRRLIQFIKRVKGDYEPGWVHHDICRRLERFMQQVEEGKSPRLMLFMPPRHGKSLIASDMFPSWLLGQHPDWEIIAASYAVSLPIEFSRFIRDRMKDESFQALFPRVNLRPDSQNAERWKTQEGGGYVAAGIGGGITGKGANVLIIDDPIKDAQDADSEVIRETAWNWFGSTAYTRLAPKSGVLVIQTRWHDDDLSGRLITKMAEQVKEGAPEEEIDQWEIVEYPAIATQTEWLMPDGSIAKTEDPKEYPHKDAYKLRDKGEALHEKRFPLTRLRQIKRQLQPRHWSALYQQNPMPDEGEYFQKSMFRYSGSLPPLHEMKIFAAFDLAIGERQQNDYTVGVVGGIDYNDQLYVFDMLRFKGDSYQIVEAILDTYNKYKPETIGIEKGQLELAIKPILKKRMRERRLYPTLAEGDRALVPITDKLTRARPLQGRMQQGMVYFLNTQPWIETAEFELLRFPGGVHDDIVDALAWLVRLCMQEDPPPKPTAKLLEQSWKKRIGRYTGLGARDGFMSS